MLLIFCDNKSKKNKLKLLHIDNHIPCNRVSFFGLMITFALGNGLFIS